MIFFCGISTGGSTTRAFDILNSDGTRDLVAVKLDGATGDEIWR